jgi:lipoprotein-anchoring transpeptidase ErfK/SrfK
VTEPGLPAKAGRGINPGIVKAQILLDRANFSPGVIDGQNGENLRHAVKAFRQANGLRSSDRLDNEAWRVLTSDTREPVLQEYTISKEDVAGLFVEKIPPKMEEMAELPHLGYRGPLELLAEKFHMSEDLLRALNPNASFHKARETIIVAAVARDSPKQQVDHIEIDKSEKSLRAFAKDGRLIAYYPATIGSAEKPAPSGTHKVTRIAKNPNYTYNPAYAFRGVKTKEPFVIQPGPNNPVGLVWIALSVEGYGIHGTPDASKVGKTSSHGCVRLTNWSALQLASMVRPGTPVEFKD